LQAGYGITKNESGAGFVEFSQSDGFNVGVTAQINLFDGLNLNRRLENARISAQNQQLRQEQLHNQIESDLLAAYTSYQQGLRLIELEEENLTYAQKSLDIALERFELGTINFIELREAQRTFISAQSRLITARYQAKSAEVELLRLSGQLISDSR
jgi:outer membrane protein TolC